MTLFGPRRTGKAAFLIGDLGPLEDDFVHHLLAAFTRSARRELDADAAVAAFDALERNPYVFRRLVEDLLLHPDLAIDEALVRLRDRVASELGFPDLWLKLTPLQRAVARLLAEGVAKAARARVGVLLGAAPPSASRMQTAIQRLQREGVADAPASTWIIADPALAAWIAAHEDPEIG